MRITLIHPAIGHRAGESYIRSWQMEPLPAAAIAGLTSPDVELRFYDDRMERIPFNEPTDAAVMSLETYTARRAYQIASEYRKRRVPVIVGGFHASLRPEEAERYAESVVVGEAEGAWPTVIDDLRRGKLQRRYQSHSSPDLADIRMNRSIFRGKRYLPIRLLETGRGCPFACNFCAVQTFYSRSHRRRPLDHVISEIQATRQDTKLYFFVDDNFAGNIPEAKEFLKVLASFRIRWVTQLSIHAAHDEEFLALLAASGCQGVLIGFETLNPETLQAMNKPFNTMKGGYDKALHQLKRHRIRVYGTFVFGYDQDTHDSFDRAVEFAIDHDLYIAAFNHLTPFPGTPLYENLAQQKRLRYASWWLDDEYHYNDIPFMPARMTPQELTENCVDARRRFYSWPSMLKRASRAPNRSSPFMLRNFLPINWMHRREVSQRNGYPLGDETWSGQLLEVSE